MAQQSSRSLWIPVLVVAVLVTTVSSVTSAAPAAPERAWTEEDNGLAENESMRLFSGDSDKYVAESEYYNWTGKNRTVIQDLLNETDWWWDEPPATPRTWTSNDVEEYRSEFSTNDSVSKHPVGADLEDEAWIQDAHASLFRIQPSTTMHMSPSESRLYVDPEGHALGLIDYRVAIPADDLDQSDGRVTEWAFQNATIEKAWVIQGVGVPDSSVMADRAAIGSVEDPGHVVNVTYSAREFSPDEESFTFAAEVAVTLEKQVEIKHTTQREDCEDLDAGVRDSCDDGTYTWWTQEISHPTQRVVVGETRTAAPYSFRTDIRRAEFPDGSSGVAISSNQLWDGARVGDGSLELPWAYYSARNTAWDSIEVTGADGTSSTPSPVHPVQVHGFPAVNQLSADRGSMTSSYDAESHQPPGLPEEINVELVEEDYNVTSSVGVRYEEADPSPIDPVGVVNGVEPAVTTHPTKQIRESNLTLTPLESNMTHVLLEVSLEENATGNPIDLRGREGYVEIAGEQIDTNASGLATVRVSNRGVQSARFHPSAWPAATPAYTGDYARVLARTGMLTPGGLGRFLLLLLKAFLPLLIVLWLLDKVPGATAWPPWKLIT